MAAESNIVIQVLKKYNQKTYLGNRKNANVPDLKASIKVDPDFRRATLADDEFFHISVKPNEDICKEKVIVVDVSIKSKINRLTAKM